MAELAALAGIIGGLGCAFMAIFQPGFMGYGVTGWLLAAITGFTFATAAGIWKIAEHLKRRNE